MSATTVRHINVIRVTKPENILATILVSTSIYVEVLKEWLLSEGYMVCHTIEPLSLKDNFLTFEMRESLKLGLELLADFKNWYCQSKNWN